MARKERGLFRMIFNDFLASLKPNMSKRLIGEDFYGTKYFETSPRSGSSRKPARHYEPVNKEDFEQEIPAEWEAWLRYRRRDAPTKEEIEANYKLIIMKRENAAKLAESHEATQTEKLPAPSIGDNPGNYPVYEEYKSYGKEYKDKEKK